MARSGRSADWQVTSLPRYFADEQLSGSGGSIWIVALQPRSQTTPTLGTLLACRWEDGAWRAVGLPRVGTSSSTAGFGLVVSSASSVWIGGAGSDAWLLHWNGGRWHKLARNSQALAGYGRDGLWASWQAVWTGRRWVDVSYQGPELLPTAFASVPGSTSAWLFGNAEGGQEVLRPVWE
jgi:hypothetical protein